MATRFADVRGLRLAYAEWADADASRTVVLVHGLGSSRLYLDPRVEAIGRSLFHIDAEGRVARRLKIPNHLGILRSLWEQRPGELLPRVRCPMLLLPARQPSDPSDMQATKATNVERV